MLKSFGNRSKLLSIHSIW